MIEYTSEIEGEKYLYVLRIDEIVWKVWALLHLTREQTSFVVEKDRGCLL